MAMPSSGSIGLKYCVGTTACSSLSQAVDGNQTGDKSLSTLSTKAGKSTPHSMREFYNYVAPTLSLSPTTLYFDVDGSVCCCAVCVCATAGLDWCACTIDSWLSLANDSGTGNGNFGIETTDNMSECSGEVMVTSNAPSRYVDICQGIP